MKFIYLMLSLTLCSKAMAWDCKVWTSNVPGMECYKAPVTPSGGSNSSSSTATQSQQQGQGQAQSSKNVNKNSAAAASASESKSLSQAMNGGNTLATSNVNSGNTEYRESANAVSLAPQIISGCQVAGQVGGSNTRGSAVLGVAFTSSECYAFIQAQAYLAVGMRQSACEILNSTDAARRAVKRGAKLPECAVPVVVVEAPLAPAYVTQQEFQTVIKKVLTK